MPPVQIEWATDIQGAVRPDLVVVDAPSIDDVSGVFQTREPMLVQTVVSEAPIERFHKGILGRFPG